MCCDPTPEHGGIEPSAAEVYETCVSPEYALNTVWFILFIAYFFSLVALVIFCFKRLKVSYFTPLVHYNNLLA